MAIANLISHLESNVGLTILQYSYADIAFNICVILFEIPSYLCLKAATPRFWLAFLLFACGALSASQALVREGPHLILIRALLGVAEAGVFPGILYYMSCWYKPKEQAIRISLLLICGSIAASATSFIVGSIPRTGDVGSNAAAGMTDDVQPPGVKDQYWRYFFAGQGALNIVMALLIALFLPNSPQSTSMLTSQEKLLALDRTDTKDPTWQKIKSQSVIGKALRQTFCKWESHALMCLYFAILFPAVALTKYLVSLLQSRVLFSTETANWCYGIMFGLLALTQLFVGRGSARGLAGLAADARMLTRRKASDKSKGPKGTDKTEQSFDGDRAAWLMTTSVISAVIWGIIVILEASLQGKGDIKGPLNWSLASLYMLACIGIPFFFLLLLLMKRC